jgi:hypothetical protein
MTLPILTPLVAFIYFGWLWHNRSAIEQRRMMSSPRIPKKPKVPRSYPFLRATTVLRSAPAKLANSPYQPEPSVVKLLRHDALGTAPTCEEGSAPGILPT